MNSLLKPDQGEAVTTEDFVASFAETIGEMTDVLEVELLMKKLQFLGLNYDPFSGDATGECQQIMENLGLTTHLQDPFKATNILLRLLDQTEARIKTLQQ